MAALRIPDSTYRLQFNRQFRFSDARALVPYLYELGISDIYASPLLEARPGSLHGYDVTDPARLNPELGSMDDFLKFTETLRHYRMGLLLDIVPNHMAASTENRWWLDVLRNGQDSAYASFFDIDWTPLRKGLSGKILLPVLGDYYARVLEKRELNLELGEDGFWVSYYDKRLPVNTGSSRTILTGWLEKLSKKCEAATETAKSLDLLKGTDGRTGKEKDADIFRQAWKIFWRLYGTSPEVRQFALEELHSLNGQAGQPDTLVLLDRVLAAQAYRLAYWRAASEEINYRRFFDINELVSLRIEDENVFDTTHAFIFRLAEEGLVTGFRIDHIDGLHDPQAYLERLQNRLAGNGKRPGFYVVAEKILGSGEELPAGWQVYGTTGYDFLNAVNKLFIDRKGAAELGSYYAGLSGSSKDFATVVHDQKRRVMTSLFRGEVRNLTHRLGLLAEEDRRGRDLTLAELEQALIEVTACLSVYRTYIRGFTVAERDRKYIEDAFSGAVRRCPEARQASEFLKQVLLLDFPENLTEVKREAWLAFAMRWQQFTGPITAKGLEDTALYLYNRLISLNEVGGNPGSTGITAAYFHRLNRARKERLPHTLNATSTHDTKRSEDVRSRINVLSEIPALWRQRVERWRKWNSRKKQELNGRPVPDTVTEYFIYQTLIGAWPLQDDDVPGFVKRMQGYVVKAAREAKVFSSWLKPDMTYEKALVQFTESVLVQADDNRFLQDFIEFQKITAFYGAIYSLAQVLLKITSPGVPDFYQGTELWDFSLVDPDNRRPVDFTKRVRFLEKLKEEETAGQLELARRLLGDWQDGKVKLYLTCKALNFRRSNQKLFAAGKYIPVAAGGIHSKHVCAFARQLENRWILVAIPRLLIRLQQAGQAGCSGEPVLPAALLPPEGIWGEGALFLPRHSPAGWQNVLTGEILHTKNCSGTSRRVILLEEVFRNFPVALLAGE
ncbi:maltooligosyl trehalose synthase [Pelotomaculum thermopropionicum SI]|uniref:Maltooligosyl trehalose synthase n=1 Tax=Pelotomaculum thermopropionicum (strain DSM 13744 / JCM 10971 / SI) TaxID=370438 RepID=A5D1W4_PELTS|nr:maltooligosyl trehalose synthase [Pelotomaculum thermopropionicum SI]